FCHTFGMSSLTCLDYSKFVLKIAASLVVLTTMYWDDHFNNLFNFEEIAVNRKFDFFILILTTLQTFVVSLDIIDISNFVNNGEFSEPTWFVWLSQITYALSYWPLGYFLMEAFVLNCNQITANCTRLLLSLSF